MNVKVISKYALALWVVVSLGVLTYGLFFTKPDANQTAAEGVLDLNDRAAAELQATTLATPAPQIQPAPAPTPADNSNAAPATAAPATAPPATVAPAPTAAPNTAPLTVDGAVFRNRWGPVQVQVTFTPAGAIANVTAPQFPDGDARSAAISARAIPLLNASALVVQSAEVDTVSGGTVTTNDYKRSLQSAIDTARAQEITALAFAARQLN